MATKGAHDRGLTLLELLVVLAILAILVLVVVPMLFGIVDKAKITADKENLRTLNDATQLYALHHQAVEGDVFHGIDTDAARMQVLVDAQLIPKVPVPKQKGAAFRWDIEAQSWEYTGDIETYLFSGLSLDDFRKTGIWSKTAAGFYSGWGLLFIENERDEYTVTTRAQLAAGTTGGYGVLFDTNLTDSNLDSGYVVQFDRGYGAIVVRERTNGAEGGALLVVKNSTNPLIPASKSSTWWTDEHTIALTVRNSGVNGVKLLTVTVDGETVISDWSFQSSGGSYTGVRSWTAGTTYLELDVQG